jgi:hypothetical protein
MVSCGSKSAQRKATVSPIPPQQQYFIVVEMNSNKFMAEADSLSYIFASQNLQKGDSIYLLQDGDDYTYSAKVIRSSLKKALYHDVYPSIQSFKEMPKGRLLIKDTTSLYLPL